MVVGLEIQYGGQNVISFVLSCHHSKIYQKDSPHQNIFKLTLSQKSFYVFRKDRQCKFIFLLSPSLDLINIISVWALKAMKVAGETLQRSWHTLPATGSNLQPWPYQSSFLYFFFQDNDITSLFGHLLKTALHQLIIKLFSFNRPRRTSTRSTSPCPPRWSRNGCWGIWKSICWSQRWHDFFPLNLQSK